MRLDEIYQSGCRASLSERALVAEVERITEGVSDAPSLFGGVMGQATVMIGHHTTQDSSVAMYTWMNGKVRTRVDVTSDGMDMESRLLLLDVALFQPPGAKEPFLVVTNTHPWMASCWRTLRFRVLGGSGDPRSPKALLDRPGSGRWCEGIGIKVEGDEVHFHYDGWDGPMRLGVVQRPYAYAYRWDGAALEERFGFAGDVQNLIEDWLVRPWAFSSQATAALAAQRLESIHDDLAARVARVDKLSSQADAPTFTYERFPAGDPLKRRVVVYCAGADSGKKCADWPTPVDFILEQRGGRWIVADVKRRP